MASQNALPLPAFVSQRITPLTDEIHPEKLFSSFVAGSITGIIGVIRAVSYAALIFSGSLSAYLNVGVGIAVFSSAMISIVVALMSSLPGMIATPLAAPTAVLAVLAAGVADTLATTASSHEVLLTVIAAIALGSLLTGLTLWLIGICGWGNAMQFIPYPVIGGFMAGTGWLLVRGAFKVMTGEALSLGHLTTLMQPGQLPLWLSGVAIATVLLIATKRFHHFLVMPGILLAATGIFYGAVLGSRRALTTVRAQGWLLGPFPSGNLWQPLDWMELNQVHWGVIAQHSTLLGLLVFVSLLSLVLTNSGIELAVGTELDINQELRAIGLANLVAGLSSTMAGNQALPSTLLVHKMGGASRLTGLFKALPCFMVLILGPAFLAYFPKPILGSLLLFLGLDLLWQWLYRAWFKLPWFDYLTILVTLVVINAVGFLSGIAVGMGLTALQFLYQCSQIDPTYPHTATPQPSQNACETSLEPPIPSTHPPDIARVSLRGFLFFGTAAVLFRRLRDRVLSTETGHSPKFLVLDCHQVMGLDSSAVLSFHKLHKLAHEHEFTLVFIDLPEPLQAQLARGLALQAPQSDRCWMFTTCDQALTWCQAQIQAATARPAHNHPIVRLNTALQQQLDAA